MSADANLPRRARSALLAVAVITACLAVETAAFASSNRNYLTVQGRVMNHLGQPVRDAWIFSLGSRRASARVDSAGWYRLEIPGATLEELSRSTLRIRIQARRSGWRFALSNGAPELGLEMRVIAEESRLSRLRVRSNDTTAVEAVANSVVLDANPRALIEAVFIGSEGAQYETPAVPLEVVQEITLAGASESIPEIGGGDEGALPVTPGAAPAVGARGATGGEPPSGHVAPPPSSARVAPPSTSPAVDPAPREESGRAKVVRPALSGRDAVERPRVFRPARDEAPPVSGASPSGSAGTASGATPSGATAAPGVAAQAPSSSAPAVAITDAAPPTAGTPPTAGPAPTTKTAPTAAPSARSAKGSPLAPARDSAGAARNAKPAAAKPARSADQPPPATGSKVVSQPPRPAETQGGPKGAAPDGDPSLQRVYSRYDPMVSVGAKPPPPERAVPEASRGGDPRPADAVPKAGMCDCTIRGTVEVQSDQPLRGRTEVVIAVEEAPQVTTSVELFMGSPRAFEIHRAPCGVHRLRLYTRSRQRFVLTSLEPRVVCRDGSKQQIRLVMEPVARWGINR